MLLLLLVETTDTFDSDVVGFCCATGEDDLFRVSFDQPCNFLQGRMKELNSRHVN